MFERLPCIDPPWSFYAFRFILMYISKSKGVAIDTSKCDDDRQTLTYICVVAIIMQVLVVVTRN